MNTSMSTAQQQTLVEDSTTHNQMDETNLAVEGDNTDVKNEVATTDNKVEETKIAIEEDDKDAKKEAAEKPQSKFNNWKCWLPVALVVLVL